MKSNEARMIFRADAGTRKNKLDAKPNEDRFYCAPEAGLACVADGVSRLVKATDVYPSPSLAELAASRLVEECVVLGRSIASGTISLTAAQLVDVFRATSEALGDFVQQHGPFDLSSRDYPGTIGTVMAASPDTLTWAHLGDTLLLLLRGNGGAVLTRDQVADFRAWRTANLTTLPANMPDRVRYLHGSVRNNTALAHSYGVLTGEPSAVQFVETGTTPLERGDRIVLATDGLTPLWSTMDWTPNAQRPIPQRIVEYLRRVTVEQLLQDAEEAEERGQIRSDDKTVVLAEMT